MIRFRLMYRIRYALKHASPRFFLFLFACTMILRPKTPSMHVYTRTIEQCADMQHAIHVLPTCVVKLSCCKIPYGIIFGHSVQLFHIETTKMQLPRQSSVLACSESPMRFSCEAICLHPPHIVTCSVLMAPLPHQSSTSVVACFLATLQVLTVSMCFHAALWLRCPISPRPPP